MVFNVGQMTMVSASHYSVSGSKMMVLRSLKEEMPLFLNVMSVNGFVVS